MNQWTKNIVIAVIIGTIIEMLLPKTKNKKYIKVVLGIYILFCILNPVVGKQINFENVFNQFAVKESKTIAKSTEYDNELNENFEEKIKEYINKKIKEEGYISNNIEVEIDKEYKVKKIKIGNMKKYSESIINEVNISLKDENEKIGENVKKKIIENLAKEFELKESSVEIEN